MKDTKSYNIDIIAVGLLLRKELVASWVFPRRIQNSEKYNNFVVLFNLIRKKKFTVKVQVGVSLSSYVFNKKIY
jgi:hypothetical protein